MSHEDKLSHVSARAFPGPRQATGWLCLSVLEEARGLPVVRRQEACLLTQWQNLQRQPTALLGQNRHQGRSTAPSQCLASIAAGPNTAKQLHPCCLSQPVLTFQ